MIKNDMRPRPRYSEALPPLIFASTPLRARPGDPGWPLDRVATDLSPEDPLDRTCQEVAFEANQEFAAKVCHDITLAGGVPEAPHIFFTQFLDDAVAEERNLGIRAGLRKLRACEEAWFVLPPWRTRFEDSSGMMGEFDLAETCAIYRIACPDRAAFEAALVALRARVLP